MVGEKRCDPGAGGRPGRRATGVNSASGAIGKAGMVLLSQAYMEGLACRKTLKLRGRGTQGTWNGFAEGCSRSWRALKIWRLRTAERWALAVGKSLLVVVQD